MDLALPVSPKSPPRQSDLLLTAGERMSAGIEARPHVSGPITSVTGTVAGRQRFDRADGVDGRVRHAGVKHDDLEAEQR